MAVIGIDLGTTNSAAGYFDGTSPVVLPSERADGLVPSVVMYHKGDFLVGQQALDFAHKDPANAVFSIKRLMGRVYDEPKVEEVRPRVNYSIVRASASDDPGVRVLLGGQEYTPVQISAMILSQIKTMAEKKLGQPVTHAVITVPAYFEERQRAATREAGRRAGFVVKRIIDEPSAAAIAYGFTVSKGMRKRILAFDLGGGTFDVSIIHTVMSQDGVNHFEVVEKRGDNWLGGDDFDRAIVGEMVAQVMRDYGFDPSGDKSFQLLAKRTAEQAKIALSTSERTAITLPAAYASKAPDGRIIDLDMPLTRSRLEELIRPYVDRCMKHVVEALRYQNMEPDDIDVVLMVGGSTLVPLVHEAVTGVFGQEKVRQVTNPFHSVALGAGIMAATLRGVQCPKCQKENDEAEQYCRFCRESLSAAVSVGGISIAEVTAMGFGIKAVRGAQPDAFEVIIPKGEPFPLRQPKSRHFETTSDNFIQIPVYEGVEPVASKNEEQGVIEITLGDFAQAGENAPAGTVVTVSMNYDRDRVVFVKVQVHGTTMEREFRLRHDRPRQGARRAAADTRKWKDELEFWLRVAERLRDKYQSYMEPRHRNRLEADLQRANQALGTEDAAAIQDACKALGITVHSCGVASTLFLAEEVQTGASPERSRRMNETVQRIKEAWAEGRKDQATELMEALRTAIAAEVRRQSRELPGQRDFGGLLRVRDY